MDTEHSECSTENRYLQGASSCITTDIAKQKVASIIQVTSTLNGSVIYLVLLQSSPASFLKGALQLEVLQNYSVLQTYLLFR